MKKFIALFVIFMFTAIMSACGTDATTTTATTVAPDAKIVTFASWNVGTAEANNLLRREIAEFNSTHSNIQIQIVESEGNWEEWLATKAAAGEFPDIVQVGNVPQYVMNNWIGDISSVIDSEWQDIPSALRDSVTYGDKVYAIPSAYNYMGYWANLDLIDDSGSLADFTNFDYSAADFFSSIEDMKSVSATDGTGTIGIANANDIINWYPAVLDTTGTIQHFVWNGTNFDLNGTPMKDAIAKAAELQTDGYTFGAYSTTKPDENTLSDAETIFGTTWDGGAFRTGQVGYVWDGSWAASSFETDIHGLFNYDFVGTPGGKVVGVSDYYGVSKTASDKAAAYEVAKYLTFGSEGINAAFDLIAAAKTDENITFTMSGLPINETQSIIDKWFETYPTEGLKNAYEKAASGDVTVLMEGNKYVPGFVTARFTYDTGIDAQITRPNNAAGSTLSIGDFIYDASLGKISYSDYMTKQLADAINYEFLKAQVALDNK